MSLNDKTYREQIQSAIKEHLPDVGPKVETNVSALVSNRQYRDDLTAVGKKVGLLKYEKIHERKVGDIIVPLSEELGKNLNKATITSVGREAKDYNIKIGDVVMYDHFSVYYDHATTVITDVENVICKCEDNKIIPVGKYVSVKVTDIQLNEQPKDIILLDGSKPKVVFEIIQLGTGYKDQKFDVKTGDLVLIGGDAMRDITTTIENTKYMFIDVRNIEAFVIER